MSLSYRNKPADRPKSKGKSAWLITWEWQGDRARVEQPVVTFLNPRWSGERVRRLVEVLYAIMNYTLNENLACSVRRNANPYPAKFNKINGVTWDGQIICGENPWLFARLVDNINIEISEDGKERVTWTSSPVRRMLTGGENDMLS